jgi:hypothetical protein
MGKKLAKWFEKHTIGNLIVLSIFAIGFLYWFIDATYEYVYVSLSYSSVFAKKIERTHSYGRSGYFGFYNCKVTYNFENKEYSVDKKAFFLLGLSKEIEINVSRNNPKLITLPFEIFFDFELLFCTMFWLYLIKMCYKKKKMK